MAVDDEPYVQVVGEAEYSEQAQALIIDVTLEVRAASDGTAFEEISELRQQAIAALQQAGLSNEEVQDGGSQVWRPWHKKPDKAGRYARRKLILRSAEQDRLSSGCAALEKLVQGQQRATLTVEARQPIFKAVPGDARRAEREAVADARLKASALADEAGCGIGSVLRIEQLGLAKRNSGAYGDEDWWGDSGRFPVLLGGAAAGSLAEQDADVRPSDRTVWVRYAVRFQLTPR